MDRNRLVDILQRASEAGIRVDAAAYLSGPKPDCMDEGIRHELMQFLSSAPELAFLHDTMLNFGSGGAARIEHDLLATHLLYRTAKVGPNQATSELIQYVELDHTPAYVALGIRGIEVARETEITDNIRIVPYEAAPQCGSKAMVDEFMAMSAIPKFWTFFGANSSRPTAALIMKVRISPKTFSDVRLLGPCDHAKTLYDTCLTLTLVARSTPLPHCSWVYFEEWVPYRDLMSSGIQSASLQDALIGAERLTLRKMTDQDCAEASLLARQFLNLSSKDRTVLSTSLDRLNRSKYEQNPVDKAIDLGIAMEILLLHDQAEHDPIALPFRLRGAWLLAKTAEERGEIARTLNQVYDCRCQAVHKGACEAPRGMSLPILLERGQDLCTEAAKAILRKGGFPDWRKLVLGIEDKVT